jgi:peptidoglycan/xylan/chitin deacetylase (PgdA/CDA1 family)
MHLLQAVLVQRRVLHWLVPLVSLWVAIVSGLAFSGASVAQAEGTAPVLGLAAEKSQAPPHNHSISNLIERTAVDGAARHERLNLELRTIQTSTTLVIDGDPYLPAGDLLPVRAAAAPPQEPLFVDGDCQTPMSLMLHSSFGNERMQLLAREILVRGLRTTTYREVTEVLRRGECPAWNSIIVSLDDFGTDWLRPYFQSMISTFTDRDLRLVVGVVVHGAQDDDAWAYLRGFEAQGNEVANHTIDHYNLARLEPNEVKRQIKGAHQIICHNLGRCPETLILPFGNNDGSGYVRSAAGGYSYIVGIPGGRLFGGEAPYYLGRIGPDNFDQRLTLVELAATFKSQPSAGAEFISFRANNSEDTRQVHLLLSPSR